MLATIQSKIISFHFVSVNVKIKTRNSEFMFGEGVKIGLLDLQLSV